MGRFINEDTYEGQRGNPLTLYLYTNVKNNQSALEVAIMADHIYSAEKGREFTLSGGWTFEDLITGDDNMKMGVYSRVKSDGKTEYSLVNKGTSPTSLNDWKNNVQQLFGLSDDMKASIEKSKEFVKSNSNNEITMIGHSKDGAEAAANAVATNKNSFIFNPATVNLKAYGLNSSNYRANMTTFIVKGDALNDAEEYGGGWRNLWQNSMLTIYEITRWVQSCMH